LTITILAIVIQRACASGEERGPVLEVIVARMNYMRAALARQRPSSEATLVSSTESDGDVELLCSIIHVSLVCRQRLRMPAIWQHG
jgi:hypothetical protein